MEQYQGLLRITGPPTPGAAILGDQFRWVQRIKDSGQRWITHDYPLAYEGWRRVDCARWFTQEYPGRNFSWSACVGYPFHCASEWEAVANSDPDLFANAGDLDGKLRSEMLSRPERRTHGPMYLHRNREPLEQDMAADRVETESFRVPGPRRRPE